MNLEIRLILFCLVAGLASACGDKAEVVTSEKGLEDVKVLESAQIQVPLEEFLSGLRLAANNDERAFNVEAVRRVADDVLKACAVERSLKEDSDTKETTETVEISTSADKTNCPIEFSEARLYNKIAGRNQSRKVEISLRVIDRVQGSNAPNTALSATILGTKIKALTLVGVRLEETSTAGALKRLREDLTGTLELNTNKSSRLRRIDKSTFQLLNEVSVRTQGLGMTTNLTGKRAEIIRNRVIKNGVLTDESVTINGKAPAQGDLEKLKPKKDV